MAAESKSPDRIDHDTSEPRRALLSPPEDILSHIFGHMNNQELVSMSVVCSRWNRIAWKNLRRLLIPYASIIDREVIRLVASRSQQLRSLAICFARSFKSDTALELLEMRNLQSLTLSICNEISSTTLKQLKDHPSLTELALVRLVGVRSVADLPPNLTSLSLCGLTDIGSSLLPELSSLSNLLSLEISYARLTNPAPSLNANFPPNLTNLDLHDALIDNAILPLVARLTRLEHLNLSGNRDLISKSVIGLTKLTKLKSLSLDRCGYVTNSAIFKLCRSLLSLESFSATKTGWRGDSLECMASLKKLKTLAVSDHQVGSAFLVSLMRNGSITDLSMRESFINRPDAKLFKLMTTLRYLDLQHTTMDDDILLNLKDLKFLSSLNINHNFHVTSAGVAHLKSLPCLAQLNLGECFKIEDDIGLALAPFPVLTDLNLDGTNITDASLEALLALPRILDLHICGCTYIKTRQMICQNPPYRDGVPINIIVELV